MARLTIVRDNTEMSATAAERITSLIEGAVRTRGSAAISLTGGHSPEQLYEFIGDPGRPWRARIDWTHVHLFWGDERNVPPDHPDSNFGLANRTLIQHVPIAVSHVHRMRGEIPAGDAGHEYDLMLRARRDEISGPLFDVMLLGIGGDAHIASIFPDSPLLSETSHLSVPPWPVLQEHDELVAGVWVPKLNQWRITQTPPALLDSAAIIMMAAGSTKADPIAAAIDGQLNVSRYPAQLLRAAGDRVEWIIDDGAAKEISRRL